MLWVFYCVITCFSICLCDEDESTVTQCAEVIREKLEALEKEMQLVLTETVVDSFRDPRGTLNSLIQATLFLPGIKNETFLEHSDMMKIIGDINMIIDMIIGDINWEPTQPNKPFVIFYSSQL